MDTMLSNGTFDILRRGTGSLPAFQNHLAAAGDEIRLHTTTGSWPSRDTASVASAMTRPAWHRYLSLSRLPRPRPESLSGA